MAKKRERYLVVANGRVITEKNTFNDAVKYIHSISWSFDVYDEIIITMVVCGDAKKI